MVTILSKDVKGRAEGTYVLEDYVCYQGDAAGALDYLDGQDSADFVLTGDAIPGLGISDGCYCKLD